MPVSRRASSTSTTAVRLRSSPSQHGRRASVQLDGASASDSEVARIIDACLARRPAVQSESPLGGGGRLLRYVADPKDPRMPRNEAFFTTTPGLLIAGLTVHPDVERRTGTAPTADQIASQLAEPPIGLLTGIWQATDGQCFTCRANQLHRADVRGRWVPVPLPAACGAAADIRMLGLQADGAVYLQAGAHCWRAGSEQISVSVGDLPDGAVLRFDADGRPCLLQDGLFRRCDEDRPDRVVELLRPVSGGPGFEPTPAVPVDLLPLGHPDAGIALMRDDKGHVYEADLRGTGPIASRRLTLPDRLEHSQGWAVTSMGLANDNSAHLVLEDSTGHRIALQRPAGQARFQPAFMLDRPLLLMRSEGLQLPADEAIQSPVVLDGHARLGHLDGVLHYSPAPDQPWERLKLADGAPLTGVVSLHTGARGFVDRRPVFALLASPPQLVYITLPGRTTWLAADGLPTTPSGGPLIVVPDVVEVRCKPIARFDEELVQAAVHADRSAVVMTVSGTLLKVDAEGNRGSIPPLQRPLAIAIGLDDVLYALDHPHQGPAQLYRLAEHGQWDAVQITLPQTLPPPRGLRSTRTGRLEVQLGARWHAVLPAMTAADGTLLAARVAASPSPEEVAAASTQSGTNAHINQQQASRISTPDHDAAISTTLLGTTSTDPLSLSSNAQVLVESGRAQASALAQVMTDMVGGAVRTLAGWTGVRQPPSPQQQRLAGVRQEAMQAQSLALELFDSLPVLAEVRIAAAASERQPVDGLSPNQHAQLVALRETALAGLLRDLRKIGFRDGALAADFSMADGASIQRTSSNPSYRVAELWRRARSAVTRAVVQKDDDLMPSFDRCIAALAGGAALHPQALSDIEHALLAELREVVHRLKTAQVALPAQQDQAGNSADVPNALRSACLLAGLVEYDALLSVADAQALEAADARRRQSRLHALAKLGLSSWRELEAFDDVVSTFRQEVTTPGSARQLQLLKSLGLPQWSAPDEMASRMIDVLQDLFNRSTFFSTRVRSAELRGSLGSVQWMHVSPINVGMGGEAIHALGVERIGDSKDGDAGLVAFFVRHAKATASATVGLRIDLEPGPGTGGHVYVDAPGPTVSATWGGAANLGVGGSYQHGVGAAVILSPDTIPEFARLLFDRYAGDTTGLLRAGVNDGAIGLDLFEININASLNVNLAVHPLAVRHPFGAKQPTAQGAATGSPRSAISVSVPVGMTAQIGVQWSQMELHLDHAWQDIIGLEFQGRIGINAEVNAGINLGGSLTSVLGRNFKRLVNAVTGAGTLQLAGVRVASSDVQLPTNAILDDTRTGPLLGTASYKRTLDTHAAQPVTRHRWDTLRARLKTVFPESSAELGAMEHPSTPEERSVLLRKALERIQGPDALAIEAGAALGGAALARQRTLAAQATGAAAVSLWKGGTAAERAAVVDMLHQLRQEDAAAIQQRARVIPGARVEINMFGRESLDAVISHAIGHCALGEKMRDVAEIRRKIPGLDEVLRRFKDIPHVNQVRFVFEMRPQAMVVINDALAARQHAQAAGALGLPASSDGMSWQDVLVAAQQSPDLYRLAAIAVHNTDENPVTSRVGLPLLNVASTAVASHQLFQAEIQFRYGLYDRIEGAEVLEAGARALRRPLDRLQQAGVQALGQHQRAQVPQPGTVSPRGERSGLQAARELAFERYLQTGTPPEGPHLRALTLELARLEEQTLGVDAQRRNCAALMEAVGLAQAKAGERIDRLLARLAPTGEDITEAAIAPWSLRQVLASLHACRDVVTQAEHTLDQAHGRLSQLMAGRSAMEEIAVAQHAFELLRQAAQSESSLIAAIDYLLRQTAEAYDAQEAQLRDLDDRLNDLLQRLADLHRVSELERQSVEDAERDADIRRQALRVLHMQATSTDALANDTASEDEAVRALEEAQTKLSRVQQQSAETRDRIGALVSLAHGVRARLAEEADALGDIDALTRAARQTMTRAHDLGEKARAAMLAMLSARYGDDAAPAADAGDDITLADEQGA
ncbi:transducer protein car [Xanthomonas nasturtii]|uniref:Transducer protein car n=1 Tax=Xanthomonas nasturtii TaxID=1843581 RepID=A0ABT0LKA2_9XANT|nr:transducer protein car [Xanthomonas nasturtii]MCL1549757.1 transducer protein car [Xanthomonas nasturtii]MCL1554086.1 transducer protein car [Xanthomonas nasturtii]